MGIEKIRNTIKKLSKLEAKKASKNYVSVVFVNDDGTFDYPDPENCNPTGVLVVPKPVSMEEWEAQNV